jgi:prolyl 4-hydroxylase
VVIIDKRVESSFQLQPQQPAQNSAGPAAVVVAVDQPPGLMQRHIEDPFGRQKQVLLSTNGDAEGSEPQGRLLRWPDEPKNIPRLAGPSWDQQVGAPDALGAFLHEAIAHDQQHAPVVHSILDVAPHGETHGTISWPVGNLFSAVAGDREALRARLATYQSVSGTAGSVAQSLDLSKYNVVPHAIRWRIMHPIQPRVLYLESTLTPAEAAAIIDVARPHLTRSRVVSETGGVVSQVRTSQGFFLHDPQDALLPANVALRTRLRALTGLQEDSWFEATQVLRYTPGERYVPHPDFFSNAKDQIARGGQRMVTVLTWLNNVTSGGTTSFPNAHPQPLAANPVLGDSIAFYDVQLDGSVDPSSYHGGDPPGAGAEKWVAVTWGHLRTFV